MAPQDTQINSQNMPSSKPSPTTLAFSVLILIVLAVAGYLFLSKKQENKPVMISGLEVAKKTASFLDKNIQPDGGLVGGAKCDSTLSEKCTLFPLAADQPHVGQAIYGYFLLAQASGDQTYRTKADKAINFVLDSCDTNVKMCEWNFFPLVQYYEQTHEDKYLTRGMLRPSESFLTATPDYVIANNVGHKLASLYKTTGDVRFKNRLVEIADDQLKMWPGEDKNFGMAIQIAWSVFVPAYKATNDSKYLTAVETYFDKFDLSKSENLRKFQKIDQLIKAGDVLLSLSDLSSKGQVYKAQAHAVLQDFISYDWDSPTTPKFTSDYGFLDSKAVSQQASKLSLHNGWLIKLFSLMKDDQFILSN